MSIEKTAVQRARVEEFQRKHRIALLTLLFTDVVGSTRLKQILGDRAAIELIQRHHAGLREILSRFPEAEEIETAGDSIFMVFAKPSDAAQFALLAQNVTRALGRETGTPVLDRVGIHVGEIFVQERDGKRRDLFGIQIDTTARIMSLGVADQILLSRFAFDNARQVLRGFELPELGELAWLNHGYYELKGVEEPVEICEVGEKGLAALTPPSDSEKAHRFHAADAEPVLGWRPAAGQLVPETRWKLERQLGQGGFGEVWLAQHEQLKQRRVLKFCFKAERARALKREVTIFRILRERFGEHPNIVAIHDVFFTASPYYLVMDYVDGPSLDRWTGGHATVAETPLETRLELVAQVADALTAAHDSGIIHRDVKPSNILVAHDRGAPRAMLTDFGIGHVVSPEALAGVTKLGFTQTMLYTGSGSGTPLYQAPELLAGQPATTRSDIYSLGVVLWQAVLGDFSRPLPTDWAEHISDPLLREDISRCVAGDPQKRFGSAGELAERLRALPARRDASEKEKTRRAELERRAYRRGLMRATAFAICVIALIAGLAIYAVHQAGIAKAQTAFAENAKRRAEAERATAEREREKARAMLIEAARSDRLVAEEKLGKSEQPAAFAYLERAIRYDPSSTLTAEKAIAALNVWQYQPPRAICLSYSDEGGTVQFSPDGQRIVTAGYDKTARLWEAQSGKLLATLQGHEERVDTAQFSPDGQRIVTASYDKTARVWTVLPPTAGPPPDWFLDFLTYMAQRRLNSNGELEGLPLNDWLALRERLRRVVRETASEDTPYLRILRHFVHD